MMHMAQLVLAFVFLLEMVLKLAALGTLYFRSLKNVFDMLSTLATSVVVVVVYVPNALSSNCPLFPPASLHTPPSRSQVPNAVSDARFIRIVLLLRLLRLLRLLSWSPHVRFVASTFVAVLPDARAILMLLFVLLYAFSALGLELFGGMINHDTARPQAALLANTSFAEANYYANNFNDLASGVVTCFELLLLNK
jgi:two pore calcium channel protein